MDRAINTAQQAYEQHSNHWTQGAIDNYLGMRDQNGAVIPATSQYEASRQRLVQMAQQARNTLNKLNQAVHNYTNKPTPAALKHLQTLRDSANRLFNAGQFHPNDGKQLEKAVQMANARLLVAHLPDHTRALHQAIQDYQQHPSPERRKALNDTTYVAEQQLASFSGQASEVQALRQAVAQAQNLLASQTPLGTERIVDIPASATKRATFVGAEVNGQLIQTRLVLVQTYVVGNDGNRYWQDSRYEARGVYGEGSERPEKSYQIPDRLNAADAKAWLREQIRHGGIALLTRDQHEYVQAGGYAGVHKPEIDLITDARQPQLNLPSEWLNNKIAPLATLYLELRGDEYRTLSGTDLENEVAIAMGLKPEIVPLQGQGPVLLYRSNAALEAIQPVVRALRKVGGDAPNVAVVPVFIRHGEQVAQVPLFRVEPWPGGERFVDHTGRVYRDFESWQRENRLPATDILVATGGHLTKGIDGKAQITAFSNRRPGNTIIPIIDTGVMLLGAGAGVAALIGSGGLAAPLVLTGASVYSTGRGVSTFADLVNHGESLSWSNPEARGTYLDVLGGTLGVLAIGGSAARLGRVATVLAAASDAVDAATLIDSGRELWCHWEQMTPLQRTVSGAQMLFWTGMMGASLRGYGANSRYTRDNIETLVAKAGTTATTTTTASASPNKTAQSTQQTDSPPQSQTSTVTTTAVATSKSNTNGHTSPNGNGQSQNGNGHENGHRVTTSEQLIPYPDANKADSNGAPLNNGLLTAATDQRSAIDLTELNNLGQRLGGDSIRVSPTGSLHYTRTSQHPKTGADVTRHYSVCPPGTLNESELRVLQATLKAGNPRSYGTPTVQENPLYFRHQLHPPQEPPPNTRDILNDSYIIVIKDSPEAQIGAIAAVHPNLRPDTAYIGQVVNGARDPQAGSATPLTGAEKNWSVKGGGRQAVIEAVQLAAQLGHDKVLLYTNRSSLGMPEVQKPDGTTAPGFYQAIGQELGLDVHYEQKSGPNQNFSGTLFIGNGIADANATISRVAPIEHHYTYSGLERLRGETRSAPTITATDGIISFKDPSTGRTLNVDPTTGQIQQTPDVLLEPGVSTTIPTAQQALTSTEQTSEGLVTEAINAISNDPAASKHIHDKFWLDLMSTPSVKLWAEVALQQLQQIPTRIRNFANTLDFEKMTVDLRVRVVFDFSFLHQDLLNFFKNIIIPPTSPSPTSPLPNLQTSSHLSFMGLLDLQTLKHWLRLIADGGEALINAVTNQRKSAGLISIRELQQRIVNSVGFWGDFYAIDPLNTMASPLTKFDVPDNILKRLNDNEDTSFGLTTRVDSLYFSASSIEAGILDGSIIMKNGIPEVNAYPIDTLGIELTDAFGFPSKEMYEIGGDLLISAFDTTGIKIGPTEIGTLRLGPVGVERYRIGLDRYITDPEIGEVGDRRVVWIPKGTRISKEMLVFINFQLKSKGAPLIFHLPEDPFIMKKAHQILEAYNSPDYPVDKTQRERRLTEAAGGVDIIESNSVLRELLNTLIGTDKTIFTHAILWTTYIDVPVFQLWAKVKNEYEHMRINPGNPISDYPQANFDIFAHMIGKVQEEVGNQTRYRLQIGKVENTIEGWIDGSQKTEFKLLPGVKFQFMVVKRPGTKIPGTERQIDEQVLRLGPNTPPDANSDSVISFRDIKVKSITVEGNQLRISDVAIPNAVVSDTKPLTLVYAPNIYHEVFPIALNGVLNELDVQQVPTARHSQLANDQEHFVTLLPTSIVKLFDLNTSISVAEAKIIKEFAETLNVGPFRTALESALNNIAYYNGNPPAQVREVLLKDVLNGARIKPADPAEQRYLAEIFGYRPKIQDQLQKMGDDIRKRISNFNPLGTLSDWALQPAPEPTPRAIPQALLPPILTNHPSSEAHLQAQHRAGQQRLADDGSLLGLISADVMVAKNNPAARQRLNDDIQFAVTGFGRNMAMAQLNTELYKRSKDTLAEHPNLMLIPNLTEQGLPLIGLYERAIQPVTELFIDPYNAHFYSPASNTVHNTVPSGGLENYLGDFFMGRATAVDEPLIRQTIAEIQDLDGNVFQLHLTQTVPIRLGSNAPGPRPSMFAWRQLNDRESVYHRQLAVQTADRILANTMQLDSNHNPNILPDLLEQFWLRVHGSNINDPAAMLAAEIQLRAALESFGYTLPNPEDQIPLHLKALSMSHGNFSLIGSELGIQYLGDKTLKEVTTETTEDLNQSVLQIENPDFDQLYNRLELARINEQIKQLQQAYGYMPQPDTAKHVANNTITSIYTQHGRNLHSKHISQEE